VSLEISISEVSRLLVCLSLNEVDLIFNFGFGLFVTVYQKVKIHGGETHSA
jgi:hypothetical protein